MELATHLEDAHIAALLREHAGPGTAAEILQEQFPYGTKIEDACRLHEEMIRIETSWAYHAYFGMLRTACAKASLPIIVSTWTPAAQQPFPFPTAVMLLHAAAATTDSGASRVDGMVGGVGVCFRSSQKRASAGRCEVKFGERGGSRGQRLTY